MDMKELYFMTTHKNILEQYDLPYTFFTVPEKVLDEETCLHELIAILVNERLSFPKDSSDFGEMVDSKSGESIQYPKVTVESKGVATPYINSNVKSNNLIRFLCFMKAYASHTFISRPLKKDSFRLYFMELFNVFYCIDNSYT
jgi:hypothetical protein